MKWRMSRGMSPRRSRKRRHVHRDDLETEEQVLAETPRGDLALEVAVGRGDDAHVDLDRLGRPDAPDLALLQDAQELNLHLRADLADLVEEQRAALGLLEEPALRRAGPRERAALVAEELALQDGLGQGAAVDRDEGLGSRAGSSRGWRARRAPCPSRSRRR